jgi:dihydrofolate reductase
MDLIVNVTENWGIGKDGKLLVSISADLKRFRQLTTGKTVILGRKTLGTFPGGRPLKNRTNLILSGSAASIEGAVVLPSLEALFGRLRECDLSQVSVIGGASVYRALLPYCERAYITKTFLTPEADTFFPNLDEAENWSVAEAGPILEEDGVKFQYVDYINTSPLPLS